MVDLFLQQVLNGLTLGGVYSLVALGLTVVYGIMAVPNFAHGAFYMVGAFAAFYLTSRFGLNYWAAMAAALAMLAERLVFRPLRNAPGLSPMIAAIGLMLFLQAGAQALWGTDFQRMSPPWPGVIEWSGVIAPIQWLLIIGGAFGLVLQLFLHHTATGATILAVAQNREGAALMGIDPRKVGMLTFGISGALAAVAAALYAPINLIYPAMGQIVILSLRPQGLFALEARTS
jgi:branched-chain amino acid transport system permease protein